MAYSFTRSRKNNPAPVEVALAQPDERVPMLDNADCSGANLNNSQAPPSDFAVLDLVFLTDPTIDVATVRRLSLPVSLIENLQGNSYRVLGVKRKV